MSIQPGRDAVVWSERGGQDGPVVVFLHGAGATGAVWEQVLAALPRSQRWVVADLPGHGRSGALPHYSTGAMAAAIVGVLDLHDPHIVVGHSLGGQIALALTDPLFGLTVDAVVVMSMKMDWSVEELEQRTKRALTPRRIYPDRESAIRVFSKTSGLATAPYEPADELFATGVTSVEGGFTLAQDPRQGALAPLPVGRSVGLAESASAVVRLMCGDEDPITNSHVMAQLGPVEVVVGAGHNPHLTHPGAVVRIVNELLARHGDSAASTSTITEETTG